MVTSTYELDERALVAREMRKLIADLGSGRVDGVAYDTAWTARLVTRYPNEGFDSALEWLRQNQYEDGSWGAPRVQYHDRFISTLAAILALREVGRHPRDERRVQRGENALWKIVGRLGRDDSDTVGFPVLAAALADEAKAMGLEVPMAPIRFAGAYRKKVNALLMQPVNNWRKSTLIFSVEALRSAIQDADDLLEANRSVGVSPSATAGYLLVQHNPLALAYLRETIAQDGSGATPALNPIDLFDIAWSLIHLRTAGAITPDDPEIAPALEFMWEVWCREESQTMGVSYSSYFGVPDVDVTAACFNVLKWAGYPVSADVFSFYEEDDHFACYPGETNPALSAHVRLLAAIRLCEDHPRYSIWVEKILGALRIYDENGSFWWDKWHASPYYVNSTALSALYGLNDELAHSRLRWILRTQNDDGGWGYLDQSTPEETAYCLSALLQWHRNVEPLDQTRLNAAAKYLFRHAHDERYTPLWIGKSLYTPRNPVKSAVLGALYNYIQLRE